MLKRGHRNDRIEHWRKQEEKNEKQRTSEEFDASVDQVSITKLDRVRGKIAFNLWTRKDAFDVLAAPQQALTVVIERFPSRIRRPSNTQKVFKYLSELSIILFFHISRMREKFRVSQKRRLRWSRSHERDVFLFSSCKFDSLKSWAARCIQN